MIQTQLQRHLIQNQKILITEVAKTELAAFVEDVKNIDEIEYTVVDEETMADEEDTATYDDLLGLRLAIYDKYECARA